MIFDCPKAQQFYAEFCKPIFDKYRNDPNFYSTASDGTELFDVQLVMLTEKDVFSPMVGCSDQIIGFLVEEYPDCVFLDLTATFSDVGGASESVSNLIKSLYISEQKYSIHTYTGIRKIFTSDLVDEFSLETLSF